MNEENIKKVLNVKNLTLRARLNPDILAKLPPHLIYYSEEGLITLGEHVKVYDKNTTFLKNVLKKECVLYNKGIVASNDGKTFTPYILREKKELKSQPSFETFTYIPLQKGMFGISGSSGAVRFYDPIKGQYTDVIETETMHLYALCQLSNGNLCAAGSDGGIRIYEIEDIGDLVKKIPATKYKDAGYVNFLASPYPDILISGHHDKTKVWSLKSYECLKTFDFGCRKMAVKVFKDYFIFSNRIFNYHTGEELMISTRYIDENNIIVSGKDFDYWYNIDPESTMENIFGNKKSMDVNFEFN